MFVPGAETNTFITPRVENVETESVESVDETPTVPLQAAG